MTTKRFLILSDIHACSIDPSKSDAPSYVSSFAAGASGHLDPIRALKEVVEQETLRPDFILCAGDLTNRADPASLTYVWQRLNELARDCGARLIATIGNHDLDSRYKANNFDPRGYAMSLEPMLPIPSRERFLEFWAENFTLYTEGSCNFVVLNTAAYHGGGKEVEREIEHGRISKRTLKLLSDAVSAAPSQSVNVLLCHHHPLKAEQGDLNLVGQTPGGDELIDVLSNSAHPWIIVHGHKHHPELFYGFGGANSPVILACASFSAQVNADAQNKNPNQVHLLICDPAAAEQCGMHSAGEVLSWTWQSRVGWSRSRDTHGLPHLAGFGYKGSTKQLATRVAAYIENQTNRQTTWTELVDQIPALLRLIPRDFKQFERELAQQGLVLLRDPDGICAQVGIKR